MRLEIRVTKWTKLEKAIVGSWVGGCGGEIYHNKIKKIKDYWNY